MSFKTDVFADYVRARKDGGKATWPRVLIGLMRFTGFRVVFLYRMGHGARRRGFGIFHKTIERILGAFCRVEISTAAEFGPGLLLPHPREVMIGNRVKFGANATIYQAVNIGGVGAKSKPDGQTQPHGGDDALIGAGARLIGPITLGDRVRIGVNAVINKDLPDDSVVVGNPMRIVRVGDRSVSLFEQDDELGRTLRGLDERLRVLEEAAHRAVPADEQGHSGLPAVPETDEASTGDVPSPDELSGGAPQR
jgi:serine O-acetyltransferase